MRYKLFKSRLENLIYNRNGYLVLASGSLALNLLLVILLFCMLGRERIVLVPPEIQKPFWVTSSKVSPEYLSEMVLFLASLSFNTTSSNVDLQHSVLLRYVDSSYYQTLKSKLIDVGDKIKKEHVSTVFYPSHVKVDDKHFLAQVSGDLHCMVGDIQLPPKQVTYQFGFSYNHGQLRITSFPEVKNNG